MTTLLVLGAIVVSAWVVGGAFLGNRIADDYDTYDDFKHDYDHPLKRLSLLFVMGPFAWIVLVIRWVVLLFKHQEGRQSVYERFMGLFMPKQEGDLKRKLKRKSRSNKQ